MVPRIRCQALAEPRRRTLSLGDGRNKTIREGITDGVKRVYSIQRDGALPRRTRRIACQVSAAQQRDIKDAIARAGHERVGNLVRKAEARTKIVPIGVPGASMI